MLKESAKEENIEKTVTTIKEEQEAIKPEEETDNDKKIELIENVTTRKPEIISIDNVRKRNIEVKVIDKKVQIEMPLPNLEKGDEEYKLTTQNESCRKLFLKIDEDDPIIKLPNKFELVEKKISKELEIEERVCHGEAMEQLNDVIDEIILAGDNSLKTVLLNEPLEYQSEVKGPMKKNNSFKEKKKILEEFFPTNVEEMLRSRKMLYEAEEKYKEQKMIYLCKKSFVMK
jgi:hypothetical protein